MYKIRSFGLLKVALLVLIALNNENNSLCVSGASASLEEAMMGGEEEVSVNKRAPVADKKALQSPPPEDLPSVEAPTGTTLADQSLIPASLETEKKTTSMPERHSSRLQEKEPTVEANMSHNPKQNFSQQEGQIVASSNSFRRDPGTQATITKQKPITAQAGVAPPPLTTLRAHPKHRHHAAHCVSRMVVTPRDYSSFMRSLASCKTGCKVTVGFGPDPYSDNTGTRYRVIDLKPHNIWRGKDRLRGKQGLEAQSSGQGTRQAKFSSHPHRHTSSHEPRTPPHHQCCSLLHHPHIPSHELIDGNFTTRQSQKPASCIDHHKHVWWRDQEKKHSSEDDAFSDIILDHPKPHSSGHSKHHEIMMPDGQAFVIPSHHLDNPEWWHDLLSKAGSGIVVINPVVIASEGPHFSVHEHRHKHHRKHGKGKKKKKQQQQGQGSDKPPSDIHQEANQNQHQPGAMAHDDQLLIEQPGGGNVHQPTILETVPLNTTPVILAQPQAGMVLPNTATATTLGSTILGQQQKPGSIVVETIAQPVPTSIPIGSVSQTTPVQMATIAPIMQGGSGVQTTTPIPLTMAGQTTMPVSLLPSSTSLVNQPTTTAAILVPGVNNLSTASLSSSLTQSTVPSQTEGELHQKNIDVESKQE